MRPDQRKVLNAIFTSALDAVAPDKALGRHARLTGSILHVGEATYDLDSHDKIYVVGAGKGAAPMASALEELLGDRIEQGLVVVKYGHTLPLRRIALREAAHPVPDAAGEKAAHDILDIVAKATERDLVLCTFTGGASALTPALCDGVSLDELRAATSLLLQCGASIHEINALRKHLSVFGGGNLARTASPACLASLIISDVVGDNLDVIASGPTAPDASTFTECEEIIRRYGIGSGLPRSIRRRLDDGLAGHIPETPKPGDSLFRRVQNHLVATNRQALEAAAATAVAAGYNTTILTDTMTGEARHKAVELVAAARHTGEQLASDDAPCCLLAGGETTVTLKGTGKGGRNQEMALAAALQLEGQHHIAMLCLGTDGTDGPTDAAGGFASGRTAAAAREQGIDPLQHLDENDAYTLLDKTGFLLRTGPTLTNVMDIVVLLIEHPSRIAVSPEDSAS